MMTRTGIARFFLMAAAICFFASCTAGDERFTTEAPAGFWYGLWHGIIVVISFIISLFSDTVRVYELNNNGAWYDFGFVLGIIFIGGGSFGARARHAAKRHTNAEWEEIAKKVERKVMRKLEELADASGKEAEASADVKTDPEWEEIGKKIEQKIKRKLRKWAEEE
jgi:hypothetical protein